MITLLQYNGSNVTPQDDAILYDYLVQDSGVLFGCTVTHLGAGQLQVADGRGIIHGRNFVVEAQTVQATLAESGTLPGRLIIQVDVANSEEPISFVTQAQNPLPDLVQEDINGSGSIFQLPLATYTAEVTQISGLTSAAHILGNTILPESKGGTGQTSLQAARNAMGLGNTLGVLPVANGGTGQSSLGNVTEFAKAFSWISNGSLLDWADSQQVSSFIFAVAPATDLPYEPGYFSGFFIKPPGPFEASLILFDLTGSANPMTANIFFNTKETNGGWKGWSKSNAKYADGLMSPNGTQIATISNAGGIIFPGIVGSASFRQNEVNYGTPNEIGQYLDMHVPQSSQVDYDARISVSSNYLYVNNPNVSSQTGAFVCSAEGQVLGISVMTQAKYDSLQNPDPKVLYVIVG